MRKDRKHLTYKQRVKIETLLKEGRKQSYIANQIGVDQSTISREIRRNTEGKEIYLADRSHKRAIKRSFYQRSKAPLKSYETWNFVRNGLKKKKWTPEVIAGRLSLEKGGKPISVQAIYQWLHRLPQFQRDALTKHLPYFNKKRRKTKYRYCDFLSPEEERRIDNRDKAIEKREKNGHWETDNMGGKLGDKSSISVSVERKSRYAVGGYLKDLKSETKANHLTGRLGRFEVETITTDNGTENAKYEYVEEKLKTKVYFCHPYRSWEKGSVENVIGWIRRYIPKGTSIDSISRQRLAWAVKKYNTTPKKCLNWLTPEEVFLDNLSPQDYAFPA